MYDVLKDVTVYIESTREDGITVGTGFFMRLNLNGKEVPVIVSVKHVVEARETKMTFHYRHEGVCGSATITCKPKWFTLDDNELCCCLLEPINEKFQKITGYPIYCKYLTEKNILTEQELNDIEALHEVMMIGYPSGVFSAPFVYPLLRKGCLALPPKENYKNGYGFADITAVGGSSGSPLFLNQKKAKLIGIVNQTVMENPLSSAHLGLYIDAYQILKFKKKIRV